MIKKTILFLLISLTFSSCSKFNADDCESKCYLHLSHTRTTSNDSFDNNVEKINYSAFDMLWLGGDLAYLSSEDDKTMSRLNSIFDLGNPNTLWALGNHDYSDLNRIEEFTTRPPYYSVQQDGITIVVLDTQDSSSHISGKQKDFLFEILDTIQESSHLILLHHKLIWMYNDALLEAKIPQVSNGELGSCSYCINPNNFNSEIYPKLVETRQRGIKVLCIGGDIGTNTKEFEHLTADGIQYLASGIKNGSAGNKALLFHHNITEKTLTWEYRLLTELKK